MTTSEVPKDESNVFPLLPAEVREPLDAFTRTLRLSDFLNALKAIAPLKVPIDPLIKTWETHLYKFAENLPKRGLLFSQNYREEREQFEIDIAPFTTFIGWLAQFELDPELRKNEAESADNEGIPSENIPDESDDTRGAEEHGTEGIIGRKSDSEIHAITAPIIQRLHELDKLFRNAKDKYPYFPAAWPLESVLPEYFGEDDPATFIAQFLATFYQVQERGPGRHRGGNWAAGLKFKLITVHNPGWREFVEGNLIDNLIVLETMHWMNEKNFTEICKINTNLINSVVDLTKESSGRAVKLNDEGTVEASVMAGQLLMMVRSSMHAAWFAEAVARRATKNKDTTEDGDVDTAEENDVDVTEEDEEEDEETVESKRNLARIQGLADVLPLIKGIVFGDAEMGDFPGPFSDEFEFSDVPRLLPLLPQAMFERVVYWASENLDYEFDDVDQFFYSGNAIFLDVILSWPVAEEALFWDDFDHPELRGTVWGETIQDVTPFDKVPHMTITLLERCFLNWFWVGRTDNIIAAARQANKNYFSPPGYSIKRLSDLIERVIERISHARRTIYAGLSPFSMDSAAEIGSELSKICQLLKLTPKHDLIYLLAANSHFDDEGFGRLPFASRVYKRDTPEETQSDAQDRAANYIRVFHAAVEEGWDEFANAALAFFLFSQPIHFENRLYVDWRDLGAALRLAPTLNGYHRVERALQIAGAMICGDGQQHYDALCLAAWVPADAPPVELPVGLTVSKRTIIEQELVECLGAETWLKLGPEAKQQLLEAELQWSKLHSELGRGMKDWGGVALAYVKPIEGELGRKLADVFGSTAFRNYYTNTYKRPPGQHIGLGNMLQLLKKFEHLDHELQQLIVGANIRLQEDGGLIKRLSHAMDLRNQGAHTGGFSENEFLKLRQLLFREGVLKRFVELL